MVDYNMVTMSGVIRCVQASINRTKYSYYFNISLIKVQYDK